MKEASQLTGYTHEIIKFYCNKGLILYRRIPTQQKNLFFQVITLPKDT